MPQIQPSSGSYPPAESSPFIESRRELTFRTGSDLYQRAAQVIQLSSLLNEPPFLFRSGRKLVRVTQEAGFPGIERLNRTTLRAVLSQRIRFYEEQETGRSYVIKGCDLTLDLTEYILSLDTLPFPELDRVVFSPIYTSKGQLVTADGYHASAKVFMHSSIGSLIPLPERPTDGQVSQARALIMEELLGDFPFRDKASKAHAVALALLPLVRLMIDGPTPLHLISAPVQGSGKTLLADCLALIASGIHPQTITEAPDDGEWRKRITAALALRPTYILIDNINRRIDSASLASVLTRQDWSDRLLGKSEILSVRNLSTWVATANNPTMSGELARRVLWIHIDPATESPRSRNDFKHPQLQMWVKQNKAQLLGALLLLVQHWIADGAPRPSLKTTFGSFEQWAEVIGGILQSAGIGGFLENLNGAYERMDEDLSEWRAFFRAWHETLGDRPVVTAQLWTLARERTLLPSVLEEIPSEMSGDGVIDPLASVKLTPCY